MKARGQKENFGDAGASEEGSERKAKDEQLVCVFECIIFQPIFIVSRHPHPKVCKEVNLLTVGANMPAHLMKY